MAEVLEAPPPYLTRSEIDGMFKHMRKPITQNAARIRYLEGLGLFVKTFRDGSPHVARSEYERVMGAGRLATKPAEHQAGSEPDLGAAMTLLNRRKGRHGAKAQGR